jgi:HEAT repeat protein
VAAIDAVAAIGTPNATAALTTMAGMTDERGIAALRALGRVRSDDVPGVLKESLRSTDPRRRLAAVEALVAQASAGSVEALAWTASADADIDVARAATSGLKTIANHGVPASGPAVRALVETLRDPARRADALDALARLAPPAIPELSGVLAADDPVVRRGVVEALGRLSHPAASACLRRALSDGDAVVRRVAILGLSRVGARGLGRQFTTIARSDPSPAVRQAAAAALHRRADAGEGDE